MSSGGRKGRRAADTGNVQVSSGGDASQLLPMAVHHHEQGNLGRARSLYQQIISLQPRHADALQYYGILCHQSGDAAEAETLIRRAIEVNGAVAPYHDNLGTVLESVGRYEEALAAYRQADALEPGDADRDYNVGVVLERLGRLEEAERRYRDALESRPEDVECRFALGNVLKQRGALDQAENVYRMVLRAKPEHAGAWVNLGNLLQSQGRLDEALDAYRDALRHAPSDANAHHNMGRALRQLGRPDEARASFEQALRHAPDLVDARVGLAQVLEQTGRLDRAFAAYRAACEACASAEARAGLLRVARLRPLERPDPVLEQAILDALEEGASPVAALARPMGQLLATGAALDRDPPGDDAAALARALSFAGDPLFGALLDGAVNTSPQVERWLCRARRGLLLEGAGDDPGASRLLRHLALQGALNEHVFARDDREAAALAALGEDLERHLAAGRPSPDAGLEADLLRYACYQPLWTLAGAQVLESAAGGWGEDLAPVVRASVQAPLEERRLAAGVRELAPVEQPVSRLVRARYEESPYPRWSELPLPAVAGDDPLSRVLAAQPQRPAVLVAGCGTGQEALALAVSHPDADVTGLDLSRASLGYALRMARALGVPDVTFVHGDLLEATRLGRPFQAITASGVLHHMEQPLDGWRALLGCLAPGGVMKVGLYSRAARAPVNAARERVAALGLAADADGVRELRRRVLEGLEPGLEALLHSEDFFATSTCRDLLFHPMEHQFDLPQIAAMLDTLGLRFLGFELPHPLVREQFLATGLGALDDLDAWARFESQHPQTFEAMYVLWCERAPVATGAHAHA